MYLGRFDGCWFAIHVRCQKEQHAGGLLEMKGYETLIPTRKTRSPGQRKAVLFPGYIFCRYSARISDPIVTTPGVIRIVGNGSAPAPVEESEIESLKIILYSGSSTGTHPFLKIGQPILVNEGPLRGARGTLISFKRGDRFIVSIHLLQRSVFVEIDGASLDAAGGRASVAGASAQA
jgi:transcription antitermination factor NusG